jgi:hypothetical protein
MSVLSAAKVLAGLAVVGLTGFAMSVAHCAAAVVPTTRCAQYCAVHHFAWWIALVCDTTEGDEAFRSPVCCYDYCCCRVHSNPSCVFWFPLSLQHSPHAEAEAGRWLLRLQQVGRCRCIRFGRGVILACCRCCCGR